jgi:hypothetical protein
VHKVEIGAADNSRFYDCEVNYDTIDKYPCSLPRLNNAPEPSSSKGEPPMRHEATRILDQITSSRKNRQHRMTELMRPPTKADPDWFMWVPPCFNAALDILQTTRILDRQQTLIWSQGSSFSFAAGDVIYNDPRAYNEWSNALPHVRYSFRITTASPVTLGEGTNTRKPGSVTFELLMPNDAKTGIECDSRHTVTQDDLVRLLITGTCDQLNLFTT